MFTERTWRFRPMKKNKKAEIIKEATETIQEPVVSEPSLQDEVRELKEVMKEVLELLKDIEYNTHDRTGFWNGRR
jgi:hypothetical protein